MIEDWAAKWGVGPLALADLRALITVVPVTSSAKGESERTVQAKVRLAASQQGCVLWRNNVGVLMDSRGVPIRYGLANDSAAVNREVKSADLIGIRPVLITQAHVGRTIGQFLSREVKAPGWRYTNEKAQARWIEIVVSHGGDAAFTTGGAPVFRQGEQSRENEQYHNSYYHQHKTDKEA